MVMFCIQTCFSVNHKKTKLFMIFIYKVLQCFQLNVKWWSSWINWLDSESHLFNLNMAVEAEVFLTVSSSNVDYIYIYINTVLIHSFRTHIQATGDRSRNNRTTWMNVPCSCYEAFSRCYECLLLTWFGPG